MFALPRQRAHRLFLDFPAVDIYILRMTLKSLILILTALGLFMCLAPLWSSFHWNQRTRYSNAVTAEWMETYSVKVGQHFMQASMVIIKLSLFLFSRCIKSFLATLKPSRKVIKWNRLSKVFIIRLATFNCKIPPTSILALSQFCWHLINYSFIFTKFTFGRTIRHNPLFESNWHTSSFVGYLTY